MATASKLFTKYLKSFKVINVMNKYWGYSKKKNPIPFVYIIAGGLVFNAAIKYRTIGKVYAAQLKLDDEKFMVKLTSREKRFVRFASVEFDGQIYMTPQDFLESVVEADPRPRFKRRVLKREDIDEVIESTPPLNEGSQNLFRSLRDRGIISYTEYLFMLSILTKPESGFRIAFNMFDTDGNERVDKNEFLVIKSLLAGKKFEDSEPMEKIFSQAWKGKRGITTEAEPLESIPIEEHYVNDEQGLQRKHSVDTTLLIHLFGPKGDTDLNFESFRKFMLHLQTEVLELEFSEFAKGLPTISEIDFAKILLRYTYLEADQYDMYLDRLLERIKEAQDITFEEFYVFCQFLNNLEDFSIAMRMYTLADHPISKDEFHRAVKICTGTSLSPHIVQTVFSIFDEDGDGLLSYREFIAIMKDRLHRGFKAYAKHEGWQAFKYCVKQEMKSA